MGAEFSTRTVLFFRSSREAAICPPRELDPGNELDRAILRTR